MSTSRNSARSPRRGGALLAVLWLSAALSAIAFAVATTVRGETERTATFTEGTRGYFLATGAIERAILYMLWGPGVKNPDGTPRYYEPGMPLLRFAFPAGEAVVEIIPESSKMNLNTVKPEELQRLLLALGTEPERAFEIAAAVADWRRPAPPGAMGPFDSFYLARTPSFPARHASFDEVEELLVVKGMTPELYYGGYEHTPEGRLVPRAGLRDCVSVYGSPDMYDVNSVEPAVMIAAGMSPETARLIAGARGRMPFRQMRQVQDLTGGPVPGLNRLGFGSSTIFTLRATARPRTANGGPSDLRRTVAALVKFAALGEDPPLTVLRWYDNAPVPARSF